jgi:PKD repeat protein
VTQGAGSGSVTDAHTYTTAGIYTIELTVTDDDGDSGQSVFQYVVVYDPSAGFVTGGGWIDSPPGAYKPQTSLTGKANFGFTSKYKKGATVPEGNTQFQFHAAGLNFHSSIYDWLVVTGSDYAMFSGTGTINGAGDYKFRIWAGDDEPDTFRIKIWEEDTLGVETVIYDNGTDQALGGGSIVIHTKRK